MDFKTQHVPDAAPRMLDGLDIPLDTTDTTRIEAVLDRYQAHVLCHLEEEYIRTTTWSDRLADRIAAFGGSWTFITLFAVVLTAWILWNTLAYTGAFHFDPAPYILLNLCLSFVAAFQAPIIMMSQNRQAARDKRESLVDFAINYKAGQEVDDMQGHLHRIEDRLERLEGLLVELTAQRANA